MPPSDFVKMLEDAVQSDEEALCAAYGAKNLPFLSAHGAQSQEPGTVPTSPREPLGQLSPTFAAADFALYLLLASDLKRFRAAYRDARLRWFEHGQSDRITFPAGSYM